MSNQPEALRVAHELECRALINEISLDDDFVMELDAARLLREQHAEIERLRAEQLPTPPEECQTEAEKKAFAFGYWSGVAAMKEGKP